MKNMQNIRQTMMYLICPEDTTDSLQVDMPVNMTQVDGRVTQWPGIIKILLWMMVAIGLPLML
jgi:hypothetical protein